MEKVVAWYAPTWLVVSPELLRQGSVQRIREMVADPTAAFSASPVFLDGRLRHLSDHDVGSGPSRALPLIQH